MFTFPPRCFYASTHKETNNQALFTLFALPLHFYFILRNPTLVPLRSTKFLLYASLKMLNPERLKPQKGNPIRLNPKSVESQNLECFEGRKSK